MSTIKLTENWTKSQADRKREFLKKIYDQYESRINKLGLKSLDTFSSLVASQKNYKKVESHHKLKAKIIRSFFGLKPEVAFEYVKICWGGKCPMLESVLIQSPKYATLYAKEILGHRWRRAEWAISRDVYWRAMYQAIFQCEIMNDARDH